jgi:FkbM family methyltransferase
MIIIASLVLIVLLFMAILPWLFVLKIGGKSRLAGALGVVVFICVVLGLAQIFSKGKLLGLYNWLLVGCGLGVLSLLSASKVFLKVVSDLFTKIGSILESKKISETLSKWDRIYLLLRLKLAIGFSRKRISSGRMEVFGYLIEYPNFNHLQELLVEIFINREYAIIGLKANPFIIDCGANIGITTLFLKRMYPAARVLCFEPDPINFEFLKKNIEANRLHGVILEQQALSLKQSQIQLAAGSHTESSTVFLQVSTNVILVNAVPLSGYIAEQVDLLKIDIEGAESQVIEDLYLTGKLLLVKNIIMEYHYTLGYQNNLAQSLAFLEKSGFSYEIHCQSNSLVPYHLHHASSQPNKVNTLVIFACNRNLGIG